MRGRLVGGDRTIIPGGMVVSCVLCAELRVAGPPEGAATNAAH